MAVALAGRSDLCCARLRRSLRVLRAAGGARDGAHRLPWSLVAARGA